MILDSFDNMSLYYGLSPRFKQALSYLERRNWESLDIGNHKIDGDKLVLQVQSYTTSLYKDVQWEAHKHHADIQMVLQGTEQMGYNDLKAFTNPTPYNIENDIYWIEGSGDMLTIKPTMFAIFFPTDGHITRVAPDNKPSAVRKLVFKVLLD